MHVETLNKKLFSLNSELFKTVLTAGLERHNTGVKFLGSHVPVEISGGECTV